MPPMPDSAITAWECSIRSCNAVSSEFSHAMGRSAELQRQDPSKRRRAKWMRIAFVPSPRLFAPMQPDHYWLQALPTPDLIACIWDTMRGMEG
eukprot:9420776-Pyramimonas_sp.AAC.1